MAANLLTKVRTLMSEGKGDRCNLQFNQRREV
jgi:hypothetical protein